MVMERVVNVIKPTQNKGLADATDIEAGVALSVSQEIAEAIIPDPTHLHELLTS